jgi:hypothetical protein
VLHDTADEVAPLCARTLLVVREVPVPVAETSVEVTEGFVDDIVDLSCCD